MLEKSMYDSWVSRICLFIKGKKHGRMMLDSINNGPLVYLTIEENGQTRPKKYSELTEAQQLQDDSDVQATNIILHGLLPDVKFVTDVKLAKSLYTNYDQLYAYLSQHKQHANEVCINHERYPDSISFIANSLTLYNPSQSPQHSSYSMYPPHQQFTLVYASPIHHPHHHTLVNLQQHLISPPSFISPLMTPQCQGEFPQLDSSLAVPMFQQGEDLIECINKAMAFLSTVASRFPPSNNQLRTLFNPRNQATIQDGRVIVQQVQRRQHQSFVVVLMVNLSSCDSEVLSKVPYSNSYSNDMINQDVQEIKYYEQTHVDDFEDNEIHSGMFKLDIEPVSTRLKNNRDTHEELLVYASQTCPNSPKLSEKLVAVTLTNKDKRVRFVKLVTYLNNIPKQTDSLKTKDSNKPLLTSIGVKPTTSASGSKPLGNTKNSRISRPPRSNHKNKVEDHPRTVNLV
nr:hypothetical protein [Tanacetum cinerariifolium]